MRSIFPEKREAIRDALRQGVPIRNIADDVGVSPSTVSNIKKQMGIVTTKPVLEVIPDVIDTIDAVLVDESDRSEIVIPTSAQEAEARLAEPGPLATAVE